MHADRVKVMHPLRSDPNPVIVGEVNWIFFFYFVHLAITRSCDVYCRLVTTNTRLLMSQSSYINYDLLDL
jgi:hypothetical protein